MFAEARNDPNYDSKLKTAVKNKDGSVDFMLSHINTSTAALVTGRFLTDFRKMESINLDADYWNLEFMEQIALPDSLYFGRRAIRLKCFPSTAIPLMLRFMKSFWASRRPTFPMTEECLISYGTVSAPTLPRPITLTFFTKAGAEQSLASYMASNQISSNKKIKQIYLSLQNIEN